MAVLSLPPFSRTQPLMDGAPEETLAAYAADGAAAE